MQAHALTPGIVVAALGHDIGNQFVFWVGVAAAVFALARMVGAAWKAIVKIQRYAARIDATLVWVEARMEADDESEEDQP